MSKKLQPRLRFKGFTDAWTQRKVGELVVNLVAGVSVRSSDVDTGVSVLKTSAVTNGKVDSSETKPVIYEDISRAKASLVKESILISRMNTPALVGAVGIVETTEDSVYLPDRLWMAQVVKDVNPNWLNQALNTPQQSQAITSLASGTSGSMKNISRSQMLDLEVNIPPGRVEQTHIGEFFQVLDNLITINQRKCDLLQDLKRAYLQHLFPTPGEAVPCLRLSGFNDDWRARPLKEVATKVLRKNTDHAFTEVLTNSAEYGIISQRDFFDKDIANDENIGGYYLVQQGDFVYNPRISNMAPVGPIKQNQLGRTGVMSPLYFVFRVEGVNGKYLSYYFSSAKWYRFMTLNGDTGARADRFAISDSVFLEMPIPIPSMEEQDRISEFFDCLDHFTGAQRDRVGCLQTLKRAYLQQMFV